MYVQRLLTIDTPDRLQEPALAIAWSSSVKDPQRLASTATGFATRLSSQLYACFDDHRIVGVVALDLVDGPVATVCQIGVHPSRRRHGIGRRIPEHVAAVHPDRPLQADTDRDAVDFCRTWGSRSGPLARSTPVPRESAVLGHL
jgi:ribosomal protein S18 acetylase RimI-like enzyme